MSTCRECHREGHHQLSCSHVRYEARTVVLDADEVAADHIPPNPYCPGPDVYCHFTGDLTPTGFCAQTGGACYYAAEGGQD